MIRVSSRHVFYGPNDAAACSSLFNSDVSASGLRTRLGEIQSLQAKSHRRHRQTSCRGGKNTSN